MIIELRTVGKATKDLINKFRNTFPFYQNDKKEIILFCDYSEFEIPQDYIFTSIHVGNKKSIFTSPVILKVISQEYFLRLHSIPIGWKTICLFEINENSDITLFNSLSEINEWSESETFYVLT